MGYRMFGWFRGMGFKKKGAVIKWDLYEVEGIASRTSVMV